MPATKECPLCGESMRLKETLAVAQIAGYPQASTRTTLEWVCPECDYFEEAEREGT